ncbi:MAG: arabinosyltransferase C-terminal domain-containing protein [Pseudonocardiaceae bacterium]
MPRRGDVWEVTGRRLRVRPFAIHDGIAEVPQYRLLPNKMLAQDSKTWSAAETGGPIG